MDEDEKKRKTGRHEARPAQMADKTVLLKLFKHEGRPLSLEDLRRTLNLTKAHRRDVRKLVKEMAREGSIVRLKNDRFGIPHEMNLEVGTLWCTRSGNGFVIPDKEGQKDIFVPARAIQSALHGDKVVVRVEHTTRGSREGKVVKITERRTRNITGFIKKQKGLFYLIPDDERVSSHFIVSQPADTKLMEGDLAACRITKFPEGGGDPECKLLKVFHGLSDVKSISQFINYKHGLPHRFTRTAESEAKDVDCAVSPEQRTDLREIPHVTIDGEYAKDFDDAVAIEKSGSGYLLYVSIADVSHYVTPRTALDEEAYRRGTSVYFPGTVIPMLPKELSNGICSLNPHEDRYAVTARLRYNKNGGLLDTHFEKSVIKSASRLTYRQVEDALNGNAAAVKEMGRLMKGLKWMRDLAALLRAGRQQKGNLDFDLPEPEVVLDMEGGIADILKSERLVSQTIIEEFMIAANEAAARYIEGKKAPQIYRVHESPDREKLTDFERLLRTLNVEYKQDRSGRLHLQEILDTVKDKEYEFLINRVLLRSMKQARYSPINKGHFGLALESYVHFTSPIRRYPDLVCHRVLKALIDGDKLPYGGSELEKMSVHLSERERGAMEAEREVEDRIRILFMKDRIGGEYEGIITRISSFGFFVELFDLYVEGLILLSTLSDDYYAFQEDKFRIIGRRTRKIFRIGDHVRVTVVLADVETKRLHFELIPG